MFVFISNEVRELLYFILEMFIIEILVAKISHVRFVLNFVSKILVWSELQLHFYFCFEFYLVDLAVIECRWKRFCTEKYSLFCSCFNGHGKFSIGTELLSDSINYKMCN